MTPTFEMYKNQLRNAPCFNPQLFEKICYANSEQDVSKLLNSELHVLNSAQIDKILREKKLGLDEALKQQILDTADGATKKTYFINSLSQKLWQARNVAEAAAKKAGRDPDAMTAPAAKHLQDRWYEQATNKANQTKYDFLGIEQGCVNLVNFVCDLAETWRRLSDGECLEDITFQDKSQDPKSQVNFANPFERGMATGQWTP
jgi:hypothetical protein